MFRTFSVRTNPQWRYVLPLIMMALTTNTASFAGQSLIEGAVNDSDSAQSRAQDSKAAKSFEPSFVISPSITWITGTQDQTQWAGSTMLSTVRSSTFCSADTRQFGVIGNASDSRTESSGSSPTLIVSNDLRADFLTGIFGRSAKAGGLKLTRNFFSTEADVFINNGLGIGLQQEYVANYQRYLRPCVSVTEKERLFGSITAGIGGVIERLYSTSSTIKSAVLPVSAQGSYIVSNKSNQPKVLLSAEVGYMPLLNDLHAYQVYGNASLQVPTKLSFLSISFNEMDLYMNNAPTGHKRNYQSGSFQLIFAWGGSVSTPATEEGACYTADTLNHLYCYDHIANSECAPPSVFRPLAQCAASAQPLERHPKP